MVRPARAGARARDAGGDARARAAPPRRGRGGAAGGSAIGEAYTYLPNSVKRFPAPAELAAELERAGLEEIGYVLLAGGIVAIHSGTVPR